MLLRSQEEILERIKERKEMDMLGFEWPFYIDALEYQNAKEWVKDSVSEQEWNDARIDTVEKVKERMVGYMDFAWEKANDFRGISAQRSIMHYIAWAWLLGDEQFYNTVKNMFDNQYEFYGKDILVVICGYLGLDASKWDDGVRKNDEE